MPHENNCYIMALDEGTTSARAVIFSREPSVVGLGQHGFPQIYPRPGWVEHSPDDIWAAQLAAIKDALKSAHLSPEDIAAIGVTNQRETTILWDKATGKPVYNAIVWQCRRTAEIVDDLKREYGDVFKDRTGLIPDSYFSGPKIKWLLDNVAGLRERALRGEILFGTVDSFLIWRLTGGRVHITDYSNASRTLLFNIHKLCWDYDLLDILGIPESLLPEPKPSSQIYGYTDPELFGASIPIAGNLGDQQAALFGQAAFDEGMAKCTYGTGSFLLINIGGCPRKSRDLLTTVAWCIGEKATYALEGSIFISGAAIQWLKESLGLINDLFEIEVLASTVKGSEGVFFVPAFVGLGAPYWDQYARGLIIGLTRGTSRAHIARAALEAIAYLTCDIIESAKETGVKISELRVDGGASKNNLLMQIQADILGLRIIRPRILETTSLGAAYMAGLAVGYWNSLSEISSMWMAEKIFEPSMDRYDRDKLHRVWKEAVKRSLSWAKVLKEAGLE
ncbi:MAG: glycerol kinase GlpK [Candidatus Bathyarchaeota archaeon]|nr:glycerol kinase GlpK [Candidatus Bathyarchaeota archaeon]